MMNQFHSIKIAYGINAIIQQSDTHSVAVESEREDFASAISIQQNGRNLDIVREKRGLINDIFFWKNSWKQDVTVTLHVREVKNIVALYDSSIECGMLTATDIDIRLEAGSSCNLHLQSDGDVNVSALSGSVCRMSGYCAALSAHTDASSMISSDDLTVRPKIK